MSAARVTRLCLVRHGETDWNRARRIQGQLDVPLNDAGEAQARELTQQLAQQLAEGEARPAVLFSSDLQRATATARPLAALLDLPVTRLTALRERRFGQFEGLTGSEAQERYPEAHIRHTAREVDFDLHGGETLRAFSERVQMGMAAILDLYAGQTVLVVSHGGVLDLIYRAATGRAMSAPCDFTVPNCVPNWFRYVREGDSVRWMLDAWGGSFEAERSSETSR